MNFPGFRIELFGAPRVLRDGGEVRLPVKKSLAMLSYLAVEGRATRAKLAGLFWGDSGDEAARRNLRRELHRLREAGLADWLVAEGEAVELAPQVRSDVAEFDEALARDERASALALWRGPLLDGFDLAESEGFERWLASRRDDFSHRFAAAARAHAREREAAGDLANALQLHARLIELDPLQESHYASAMRLHYLAGDRGRAIDLFERCRAILHSELGLEPLPETAALAEHVRAAERVAPLAGAATTAGLAQLTPPLIGRAAELAQLAGGPVVTLICGEPGVGKTRLADEYTRSLPRRSRMAASELGRAAPLFPVVEALHRAVENDAQRATLLAIEAAQRRELLRLVPALDPAMLPTADDAAPAAMRARLIDAVATALIALAGDGALWVDDVHWLDELTLEALHHLAHRLARERRSAPRIVLTARSQELADRPEAHGALLKLERAHLLQRIDLAPLSADDTTDFVQRLSGAPGNVFAERLHRATRGNPFFLLETIRFLFDSGELSIDARGVWSTRYDDATSDYAELPVPPNVQQAVLERVERLGPAARRVLEAAALAGDGFTLDDVQPATALSEWEALEGLERAASASLISGAERSYRFGHDLVRLALDRNLGAERRRLIHLRLAESLAGQGGRPDRIARHFDEAGHAKEAIAWHLAAARSAERIFAHREALDHYRAALAATVDPEVRIGLHRSCAESCRILHDVAGVASELDRLDDLARDLERPTLAAEVLVRRAVLAIQQQRHRAAVDSAVQARLHPGFATLSQTLHRDALIAEAFGLVETGHYDEARAIYQREFSAAPDQDRRYRGDLHYGMANLLTSIGANPEAGTHFQQAADLFAECGDGERRAKSLNLLAYTQYMTGDTPAAIATMDSVLAEAERFHSTQLLRNALLNLVAYCLGDGDFSRATALTQRAVEVLRFSDDPATQARLQIRIAETSAANGDLGAALIAARHAVRFIEDNAGGLPDFWPWFLLATLLWRCGDCEGATGVYRELPRSKAWLPTAAPAVALFTAAYGLPGNASDALAQLADVASAPGVMCETDQIIFFRAYALHALGRNDEAGATLVTAGRLIEPSPFALHRASVIALQLEVEVASRRVQAETRAAADRLLATAPPVESIELLAALARAAGAAGESDVAAGFVGDATARIDGLADSLRAEPRLAASFRARWSAHLANA